MATLKEYGFDDLQDALNRIAYIPESVKQEALNGMADIAAAKIRAEGASMGVRDPDSSVHILDKISKNSKAKLSDAGGYKMITFTGNRRRGDRTSETRNAEIAFVNEYGKRNQPARPFILTALNNNAEEITDPAEKAIGDWIEKEWSR